MSAHDNELHLGHQFEDLKQQIESYTVGMWIFLVTEVMFFGGLFTAYIVYRAKYPEGWFAGHHHLDWKMGGLNTLILLTSSLTMALAVRSAMVNKWRPQIGYLVVTMVLAFGFMVVKFFEYSAKFEHHVVPGPNFANKDVPGEELFMGLYFAMTGLHGFHVLIGILVIGAIAVRTYNMRAVRQDFIPVELVGLYWHFVDIVWIFLYPLLYLISR
ncbi:MAG: cytochrome c oxidase subunit 3 family protein [Fimbriimonadales bacterium]